MAHQTSDNAWAAAAQRAAVSLDIRTFTFDSQPCWVVKDAGRAMGYGRDGSRFTSVVTRFVDTGWREFTGAELARLKAQNPYLDSKGRRLVVVYADGLISALDYARGERAVAARAAARCCREGR